jgi:SAM-dependent methyltransferase
MAYNTHDVRFLFSCFRKGASFKKTLIIGRTKVWVTPGELHAAAREFGIDLTLAAAEEILKRNEGYCEPLFELLGAEIVQAMDVSSYEGATLIHDLNQPLPGSVRERFTAVVDGGSLEHVFNIVEAFKSCMELTAEGGSFISLAPANNFLGHGFHQPSPEFFFGALGPENGFTVRRLLLHENRKNAPVFEVMDPREFGGRVNLCNRLPVFLKAWAVREKVKPLFEVFPQQPDWADLWQNREANGGNGGGALSFKARARDFVRKTWPGLLSEYQRIRIEGSQETGFKPACYKETTY